MEGVTQTILAGDPSGRLGNCLQAAVATLLGLPLDDVPHFAEYDGDWFGEIIQFGCTHGYQVSWRTRYEGQPELWLAFGLAFGPTVRSADVSHAVAIVDGEVWDPHPSRAGLTSVETYVEWKPLADLAAGEG